ncbi:DUF1436 family protein [Chitinophaga agrisoli]|uniref:DUF1436 family protein n=1 Tax=Chitinophaga agrisoli TaxID=2607653 RepID=A0A5B2VIG0_9BACT|nr:contact-dependent growth inhibition system immunity protein [Chitinophaga agrisoli]KAA2238861.1 DUF1436 family protein [Chitinophaga agrisoli]
MATAAIYKLKKKGYWLHANKLAVSGFALASDPYIQINEADFNENTLGEAIKSVLDVVGDERVPDPVNWSEQSKEFLKKMGLKSQKELDARNTFFCDIELKRGVVIFTPTKHAEPPDKGFVNKSKEEPTINVPFEVSNEELARACILALSRCE